MRFDPPPPGPSFGVGDLSGTKDEIARRIEEMGLEKIQALLAGQAPTKVIVVPGKLVNIVVK